MPPLFSASISNQLQSKKRASLTLQVLNTKKMCCTLNLLALQPTSVHPVSFVQGEAHLKQKSSLCAIQSSHTKRHFRALEIMCEAGPEGLAGGCSFVCAQMLSTTT